MGLIELTTGAAAVLGGLLLVIKPDGSLLSADPAVLKGTSFDDWRLPGVLLATLVGFGFVAAGIWQLSDRLHHRELSFLAGIGLVCFESAELAWLGFQPLEIVFAAVGAIVTISAWRESKPGPCC